MYLFKAAPERDPDGEGKLRGRAGSPQLASRRKSPVAFLRQ